MSLSWMLEGTLLFALATYPVTCAPHDQVIMTRLGGLLHFHIQLHISDQIMIILMMELRFSVMSEVSVLTWISE